ncbi:G/U mismatch-specific DNA glycosylase [Pseudalkalibacillus berkeleyi]|uniref:G/U mismatch-specific DNA glycosylase n=1 Tax=Pseudalkalibacillus berkeleyi TaxID=1069813 RepID=A0ABS9GX37_9BACL|nr:G/U mismatch-specific DNA glycosylase [Pseudalkalibacillus berkeleyi]MCF6137357.1 G/U mismatch-specific DNA glycosylase [Pseudalkalibacillus berkeleyi]
MLNPVPDLLDKNLRVIFVGFNPSIRSSETGHNYANPTNRFWKILYQSGLTERLFKAHEGEQLMDEYRYGFTNIVSRPTKEAADITKEEYEHGKIQLLQKIEAYSPSVVCFVGKGVYKQFSGRREVQWGFQDQTVSDRAEEFVAPSSSGLVRMKLDEVVSIYEQLSTLLQTRSK